MTCTFAPAGTLTGHAASVLCCVVGPGNATIASGTEDGRLCIFDLGTRSQLQSFCVPKTGDDAAVTALAYQPLNPEVLFAAAGKAVHCMDLRVASGANGVVTTFDIAKDEIGTIAVNRHGSFLAAGDDAGDVSIVDLGAGRILKSIRAAHGNICSALAFRSHRPWELLTGGLDSTAARWDFSRGRCLERWHIPTLNAGGSDSSGSAGATECSERQVFNPPMVHSLSVPPTDERPWCTCAALACGDGTVVVLDADITAPQSSCVASTSGPATPVAAAGTKFKGRARTNKRCSGKPGGAKSATAAGTSAAAAAASAPHLAIPGSSLAAFKGSSSGILMLGHHGGGHTRPASCVCWSRVGGTWHVVSAGQDRRLLVWGINASMSSCGSLNHSHISSPSDSLLTSSRDAGGYLGSITTGLSTARHGAGACGAVGETACSDQQERTDINNTAAHAQLDPPTQQHWNPHQPVGSGMLGRKPNAVCCADLGWQQLICVADTGRTLTLYQLCASVQQ